MKKLGVVLALLLSLGCTHLHSIMPKDEVTVTDADEKKKEERFRRVESTGLDIDTDNNNAVDIGYGGTNATTAGQALTNLGAESETHASEHSLGGSDTITVTNLASSCTDDQVLGGTAAGTGVECQSAGASADVKVAIDSGATAGYLGAAAGDGVLRSGGGLSYVDGGDYVTLDLATDGTDNVHINWADIDNLDDEGQLTVGSAVGDTAFTDLTAGDSYTNFGGATDDTIDELFAAIDTAWSSGDITKIGDCSTGDCFDGVSGSGTEFHIYDGDSHYVAIVTDNLTSNRNLQFRDAGGWFLLSGDTLTGAVTATFDSDGSTATSIGVGAAIGDTNFTDLDPGDTYTNFGAAEDDTINELFKAIDDDFTASSVALDDVGPPDNPVSIDIGAYTVTLDLTDGSASWTFDGSTGDCVFDDGDFTCGGDISAPNFTTTGSNPTFIAANATAAADVSEAGEFAIDTSTNPDKLLFYDSDTDDGSDFEVVTLNAAQTLTNKTYSGVIDYETFGMFDVIPNVNADVTRFSPEMGVDYVETDDSDELDDESDGGGRTLGPYLEILNTGSNNREYAVRVFAEATDQYLILSWSPPPDYDATSGFKFRWYGLVEGTAPADGATVEFVIYPKCFENEETADFASYGTEITSVWTEGSVTTEDVIVGAWSSASTEPAAGDICFFLLHRDRDDATYDTEDEDIPLWRVQLKYKRNLATDSF